MTAKPGPKPVRSSWHIVAFERSHSRPIGWLTSIIVLLLSGAPAVAESSWLARQTGGGVGPRLEMEDVGSFIGSLYFRECIRNEMAAACKALTDGSRADVRANSWAKARAHEKLGQLNELRGDSCAAIADYVQSAKLNPTKPLQARINSLAGRLGGTCQVRSDQQDYLNALATGTQRSANARLGTGPLILPDWVTSIRWARLPKLERLRILKDLGHHTPVKAAETVIGQEIEAVDPSTVLLTVRSSELDRDDFAASLVADSGTWPIEATSADHGRISATRSCNPSHVAMSPDCSPLSTGSLPNFVPVNFSIPTKNLPATGIFTSKILPFAVLVLLSGFVLVIARTSWQSARHSARVGKYHGKSVGHRIVVDDRSGRLDPFRSGLATRLQRSTDEANLFDTIDRTQFGEPDHTDVLLPSREEPVLAAAMPDTVNAVEPILEFSVDRAAELQRALGLVENELEEEADNIHHTSADALASDSARARLTNPDGKTESHLIALTDTPGGLLILDGDGRVTKELRARKALISEKDRAKPILLVAPDTAKSAGILNPFVGTDLGSDPLFRQQHLSAQFDLHAWIFEAMFGVSFVAQNQNTLRHFSKMLVGLPNASFRIWHDLLSEECLPTLPSYAHIAGVPETATFFETVLDSKEFQFVTKHLQKSISSYVVDPSFEHLTTATTSGADLQFFANNGYLIVFSAEGAQANGPASRALSRMFLASAAGLRSAIAPDSYKLSRATLIVRDAHGATAENVTEIQGILSRMMSLQGGLIFPPNPG